MLIVWIKYSTCFLPFRWGSWLTVLIYLTRASQRVITLCYQSFRCPKVNIYIIKNLYCLIFTKIHTFYNYKFKKNIILFHKNKVIPLNNITFVLSGSQSWYVENIRRPVKQLIDLNVINPTMKKISDLEWIEVVC